MDAMEHISRAFEWVAVGVLLAGFILGVAAGILAVARRQGPRNAYLRAREVFGRGILLGLELLVAADLIRTVAVQPTLRNVSVLGLIVVVRTLLSFALDVEIDGVLPWRRRDVERARGAAPRNPG